MNSDPDGSEPKGDDRLRRWVAHLRWQASNYLYHYVEGDHNWGQVRLLSLVVAVLVCVALGRLFETVPTPGWYITLTQAPGLGSLLPEPLIRLGGVLASFITVQVVRHAIPPVLGVAVALYFGTVYLKDLLELPHLRQALKYLTATLFGSGYPHMTINEGKATLANPETNPMAKIGGPGWVDIKIGNAALFERVVGPSSVQGAGTHFLRRFETLREAFDLREFERVKTDVRLVTRDGVPIIIQEMRVRFRIGARKIRSEANPYPALKSAIRRAAYSRKVTANGLDEWVDVVTGAVRGTVTEWISKRRMDELIPPPLDVEMPPMPAAAPHRRELHALLREKRNQERFADLGADILWVSIGHIRPDPDVDPDLKLESDPSGRDKIHQQLIAAWQAKHAARAQDLVISARAYASLLDTTTRADAECDLIQALTKDLRKAKQGGAAIDDVLIERLASYVGGVGRPGSASKDADRIYRLLVAAGLLEDDEVGKKGDAAGPGPEPDPAPAPAG